jgi:pSer/pThr/pTyr-binding forkhead associated (FHA) protein
MLGQPAKVWPIRGGMMRIGSRGDNDLVLPEVGVSREHAEIFCRDISADGEAQPTYFLRDFSRYGTLILGTEGWQRIHRQEVPLQSGAQLKFGNPLGQTLEFLLEQPNAHQNE